MAGALSGNRLSASSETVAELTRPVIRSHRVARESEVLAELGNADRAGRADRGVEAVWHALHHGTGLHLIVEYDYAFGAYITPAGNHVLPAAVPETPSATDDLVDEMIELALSKQGTVSFVEPGALGVDGVAVIRNYRLHQA